MHLSRIEDRFSGNVEVPHDFPLGVVKMLYRIANLERLSVGIRQRVPDNIEPIAVAQLRGFLRLVGCQTNRFFPRRFLADSFDGEVIFD